MLMTRIMIKSATKRINIIISSRTTINIGICTIVVIITP